MKPPKRTRKFRNPSVPVETHRGFLKVRRTLDQHFELCHKLEQHARLVRFGKGGPVIVDEIDQGLKTLEDHLGGYGSPHVKEVLKHMVDDGYIAANEPALIVNTLKMARDQLTAIRRQYVRTEATAAKPEDQK